MLEKIDYNKLKLYITYSDIKLLIIKYDLNNNGFIGYYFFSNR